MSLLLEIRKLGVFNTFFALCKAPIRHYRYLKKRVRIFSLEHADARFAEIYESNYWDNTESVSGSGSTLRYTENLRKELPRLLQTFSIKSMVDAPCGDFNWMRHFLKHYPISYIGLDVVDKIVEINVSRFKSHDINFMKIDLTRGSIPRADLMLCRDMLFHLSYKDIFRVIDNFIAADIPYLLTTTHINNREFVNFDIDTGDYRKIDLFSFPFNFPERTLFVIDDWNHPEPPRMMCLWHREQIIAARQAASWQDASAVVLTD